MDNKHFYCVIMAGGAGTRFWPVSRTGRPKQFLDVAGTGKTFLRHTYERFAKIIAKENILVCTTRKYKDLVMAQLPELPETSLLLEPYGRNTAPGITYATYSLLKRDPQAVMVTTPADQLISNEEMFSKAMLDSLRFARDNRSLVTVGIVPTRPDTNYGYIQVAGGAKAYDNDEVLDVKTFTEKPSRDLAKVFMQSGEFLWNSGIFAWRADVIKEELETNLPEVTNLFADWKNAIGTSVEREFIEKAYMDCQKISIDYAILEKTERAKVYPAKFGWFDIGAWDSLYDFFPHKDSDGNAIVATKTLKDNSFNNLIVSDNPDKLVAVKGLDNCIIIDTEDVLMICPKDEKQFQQFIAGIAMPGFEKYR